MTDKSQQTGIWFDVRDAWPLFVGVGFIMLGNGLQGTLLGLRATLEGFSTLATGVMMSGYFIGIFIGSMLAPRLVSRVGHIRVFGALASAASIAILVHSILIHPATWFVMRLVTGISYAGLFVVSESWLNDRASNETRGKNPVDLHGGHDAGHGPGAVFAESGRPQASGFVHSGIDCRLVWIDSDAADGAAGTGV